MPCDDVVDSLDAFFLVTMGSMVFRKKSIIGLSFSPLLYSSSLYTYTHTAKRERERQRETCGF
jgi:hypothetical protein